MGEFTLGTAEANALQGGGWYSNEADQDVGSIQWAGGPDKRATMRITIPAGTEGLLLKIIAAEDSLWMTVIIEEDTAAVLLVDAYWHSGYVPWQP